jgi:hypothetical protein
MGAAKDADGLFQVVQARANRAPEVADGRIGKKAAVFGCHAISSRKKCGMQLHRVGAAGALGEPLGIAGHLFLQARLRPAAVVGSRKIG